MCVVPLLVASVCVLYIFLVKMCVTHMFVCMTTGVFVVHLSLFVCCMCACLCVQMYMSSFCV